MPEPRRLARGKAFHKKLQDDWARNAEGKIYNEQMTNSGSGRRGRMDIFVDAGDAEIAIVEIKDSDWDAMTDRNLRRNARRYIRQVWRYIDAVFDDNMTLCPGIIFSKRPRDPDRLNLLETMFNDEGLQVVWDDETINECKTRNSGDE